MSGMAGSSRSAGSAVPPSEWERGRSLVLAAFDEARSSGRQGWQHMTIAVLKNRLLNSTHREFRETDFGVRSMVEFVGLYPDDLELDTASRPPMITLTHPETLPAPVVGGDRDSDVTSRGRIRSDLWQGIVDYRSGASYVWDQEIGIARTADHDDVHPLLPTVNEEEVAAWRGQFIDSIDLKLRAGAIAERLDEWKTRGYGSAFLPAGLRRPWNSFFSRKVIEKLHGFFTQRGLEQPTDLVVESAEQRASTSRLDGRDAHGDHRSLRALVQRCVAVMTDQELEELRISPAVFLRASKGRS